MWLGAAFAVSLLEVFHSKLIKKQRDVKYFIMVMPQNPKKTGQSPIFLSFEPHPKSKAFQGSSSSSWF